MLNFPNTPSVGQQYSLGTKTWEWNGVAWDALAISEAQVERAETAADEAEASAVAAAASASVTAASLLTTIAYFSGDAVTVAFTLPADPVDERHTQVHIGGAYMQKSSYSVSGTTLTFSAAPPTGTSNIEVEIGPSSQVGTQVAAPANATATGVAGTWATDGTYIYICSATNTWKRAAVATW